MSGTRGICGSPGTRASILLRINVHSEVHSRAWHCTRVKVERQTCSLKSVLTTQLYSVCLGSFSYCPCLVCTGSHLAQSIAKAGLRRLIFLPPAPPFWNYWPALACPVYIPPSVALNKLELPEKKSPVVSRPDSERGMGILVVSGTWEVETGGECLSSGVQGPPVQRGEALSKAS